MITCIRNLTQEKDDRLYLQISQSAKQKKKGHLSDNIYVSDADRNTLTNHGKIKDRWHTYFEQLYSVTNTGKELDKCDETEDPIPRITAEETRKHLQKLKNRKANGPDNLPIGLSVMQELREAR